MMCSLQPLVSGKRADLRLQEEAAILQPLTDAIEYPPSAESMTECIQQHNPRIMHIAGHNQCTQGAPQIVGFYEGIDSEGLTEAGPQTLATLIVQSAKLAARKQKADCALS